MKNVQPLPKSLVESYGIWRDGVFQEKSSHYSKLADQGQSPPFMVISCCDSRLHVTEVFGANTGDIFAHRNVANLVPPYAPDGDHHGTSAAVEYGVRALKVSHLVVIGHSQCGGVQACYDMCTHGLPEEQKDFEFVAQWLEILAPAFQRVDTQLNTGAQVVDLGQKGVVASLENLLSFPFVAEAVAQGTLALHGAWHDIGSGTLHEYNPATQEFVAL